MMDILLGIFFLLSLFLMMITSFLLAFDMHDDVITRTKQKCCLVCSVVLFLGCISIMAFKANDDSAYIEHVETRLKKCIERFPEYQDRCVIPVK